jgi:polyisoprenoid-binding protein YceI
METGMFPKIIASPLLGLAIAVALIAGGRAATEPTPSQIPRGTQDVTKAVAGEYTLDPQHVGVIARVSHLGFSMSVFRFGTVSSKLSWDPAKIASSHLTATVDTGSLETNVAGFATDLTGPKYLKSTQFPHATFVSTAFRQTDGTHGKVEGKFTLMGHTVPATLDVTLVGAGPGFAGGPTMGHVIGIHGVTHIDPQAFGLSPFFVDPIEISVDTEYYHKG